MFLGSSENAGSLEDQDYRTRCGDYPQPTGFVKISRGNEITLIFNFIHFLSIELNISITGKLINNVQLK